MSEAATTENKKPSALDKLKALGKRKAPEPGDTALTEPTGSLDDPAIANAKLNKNTVTLGYDPNIADAAKTTAELYHALRDAKSQFEIFQSQMRDYGADKRVKYNKAFRNNVTTVQVPFFVEAVDDGVSETPGREERFVQVICTNKYSVSQEPVLQLRDEMDPDAFDRLFKVEEKKVLKPDAEDLIRDLLGELGIEGEELDNAMDRLTETEVKVKTTADYEQEVEKVDESVQTILGQAVRRQAPGLKFP